MQLNLPQRSGRHLLYAIWQRSDSTEAFYSCSDVTFGGANGTPPPVPSTLQHLGQIQARQDLPAGASVRLRVFDRTGADVESHAVAISASNRAASQWLTELANTVDRASQWIRVGELQGGTVTVPAGRTVLQVYALSANSGVRYALDTRLPPSTGTPPPPAPDGGATTWTEGRAYARGEIVSYAGRRYRCLQSHTAWIGAGWQPDQPGVVNVLWQAL